MNITAINTFLEVVSTGSLNRAADRLNVTQSTVTARINALEEQLGDRLILRKKSGAELTSAGFKFQRYAELILQSWRQARHEISLPESNDAVLNIGCHFDLWESAGQVWLDDLRARRPNLALSVWGGEQSDMDRWMGSGLVDACLCFAPKVRENALVRALHDEPIVLVSSERPDDPYPEPPYLYTDLGESFRRQHAEAYPDALAPSLIYGTALFARDHLLKHGGVCYLPESMVAEALARGDLATVPNAPVFTRRVYLVADERTTARWDWFEPSVERLERALGQECRPSRRSVRDR